MATSYRYKAFISYSHKDEKWASWLHRSLESYRIPKQVAETTIRNGRLDRKIGPVFRDRDELASSSDLPGTINQALEGSETLIVLCSPAAAKSTWVNKEIEAFKKLGRSQRIFCLLVDGYPSEDVLDSNYYPPAIKRSYAESAEVAKSGFEPLAADVRKSADGKLLAKLKLIAGILNIELDQLRRREAQRRKQRYMLVTGSSLAATVFTMLLAINAIVARDEAVQRRAQAEELLSFMVGDLRTSLAPIGQLDLLEGIADKAMEYFVTVDPKSLSESELLRQSEVLTQLGEVRLEQLDYDGALAAFTSAYDHSAKLQKSDPINTECLFRRGQAEYWIGHVHYQTGSLNQAFYWWESYRNTSAELVNLEPQRDDYKRELGYSYLNLAVLYDQQGDDVAAKAGYQYLLGLLEELHMREASPSIKMDIANTVTWLGTLELETGSMVKALDHFTRSQEIFSQLWQQNKEHSVLKERLAISSRSVGQVEMITGNSEAAIDSHEYCISLLSDLVAKDGSNLELLRQLAATRLRLAELLITREEWREARTNIEWVLSNLPNIESGKTTDVYMYSEYAFANLLAAQIAFIEGKANLALQYTQQVIEILDSIETNERLVGSRTILRARAYLDQVVYYSALELLEESRKSLEQAKTVAWNTETHVKLPGLLDVRARILEALDKPHEAEQIKSALRLRGFIPTFSSAKRIQAGYTLTRPGVEWAYSELE